MALGTELLGKAIISVKADTAQARAEIAKLSAEEQKAAKARVKASEEANAAMERSAQKYALWAAAGVAAFAIASASVKKYEEHLKSLGSGGEAELRKIQNASETLSNAQEELQFAIARVALAAAPAAEALGAMATEIANIVDGIGNLANKVTGMVPGGSGTAKFAGKWGGRAMFGLAGVGYGIYSDATGGSTQQYVTSAGFDYGEGNGPSQEEGREVIHPSVAKALGWRFITGPDGGYWRPPTDAERSEDEKRAQELADAAKRQAKIYADAWRSISGEIDVTSGKARGGYVDDGLDAFLGREAAEAAKGANFGQFGEYEEIRTERLDASMAAAKEIAASAAQRESLLESIFGPVEEFELYTTAWQGLESVVTAGFEAWIDGSKSVGAAMKEALHGFAKQLAGEALLQALRHGAYALGSLAFGDVKGATAHGISAAKWAGVAVAAGVVGKVTAPSQGAAGTSSNSYAAAGLGGPQPTGGSGGSHNVFIIGDSLGYESPRSQAQRVRRSLDLADERTRSSRSVAYS